jgi:hypothetical protein
MHGGCPKMNLFARVVCNPVEREVKMVRFRGSSQSIFWVNFCWRDSIPAHFQQQTNGREHRFILAAGLALATA